MYAHNFETIKFKRFLMELRMIREIIEIECETTNNDINFSFK